MVNDIVIDINPIDRPQSNETAEFDPTIQRVNRGDIVFWRNNDEQSMHQPMPVGGRPNDWVNLIPVALPGDPATSTRLGIVQNPRTVLNYVCALHSEEKGTIEVI
jgi:hypothetical protein